MTHDAISHEIRPEPPVHAEPESESAAPSSFAGIRTRVSDRVPEPVRSAVRSVAAKVPSRDSVVGAGETAWLSVRYADRNALIAAGAGALVCGAAVLVIVRRVRRTRG